MSGNDFSYRHPVQVDAPDIDESEPLVSVGAQIELLADADCPRTHHSVHHCAEPTDLKVVGYVELDRVRTRKSVRVHVLQRFQLRYEVTQSFDSFPSHR